ncbi:hypothetical protein JCM10213_003932 [Rhodosporidiobolus nylandii]
MATRPPSLPLAPIHEDAEEDDLDAASLQALSCAAPIPPEKPPFLDGSGEGPSVGEERAGRSSLENDADEHGSLWSSTPDEHRADDGLQDRPDRRGSGSRSREASRDSVQSSSAESSSSVTDPATAFAEAKALYLSGVALAPENPYAATLHFRQAASVFAEIPGQKKRVEKCLWQGGMCWARLGIKAAKKREREGARAAFEEAEALFYFIGETSKEAMALYQLGLVTDDIHLAAEHIKRAAILFGELNDLPREAMCYAEAAHLFGQNDPDTAVFFLKQCLLLYMKLGDSNKEGKALFAIGSLAAHLDRRTANNYYLQARVIFRRRGNTLEDANCSYQLGKLAAASKSFEAAVSYFEEASTLFHQAGQTAMVDEAWALYRLALVMLKVKTPELAIDYLTEARNLFASAGNEQAAEGSCLMRMGEILGESNPELAKALLEEALDHLPSRRETRIGRRSTLCLRKLEDRSARQQARKERGKLEGVREEPEPEEAGRDEVPQGREEGGEAWWAVGG